MNTQINRMDGIHNMVKRDKMSKGTRKLRDSYAIKPDAPIYQSEFGYMSLDRWKKEGYIDENTDLAALFNFDEPGDYELRQLGGCIPEFFPFFEEKILEDRGEHEVILDFAGRHVLYFKGRKTGYMPEYLNHPVKDIKTWKENCKWRLDPKSSERYTELYGRMEEARKNAGKGMVISQELIGGYMYLRSLIGPLDLLYKFYDDPGLIHECMKSWFELADAVISKHQQYVTLDVLSLAEDISYNKGSLISPDMMREFLFPYYQQLIANIKSRQIDRNRHLFVHVDTDGLADSVIPVYKEIGMDFMSPFEVASGCDVVETGRRYPNLIISGGIDKRVLAQGKDAIDRHIDDILPIMKKRGGYIPTCDHGVPEEVGFDDYMHFRMRLLEYNE
ncbi:MAG: uroporphyrinogen decarboxylase family protein [Clostridiales bacterium]|nr:uroporphyrinogen decarboxylase family protein [Clostridiales bacterium]